MFENQGVFIMNCSRCGSALPAGVSTCPRCAQPTPYNAGSSSPNHANYVVPIIPATPPVAPTVYATPEPPQPTPPPPPATPGAYASSGASWSVPPPPPPTYPQGPQAGVYVPPGMVPVMAPPPKKSGLTATLIIVIVFLLVCVCGATVFAGGLFISGQRANANATATADSASSTSIATSDNATSTAITNSLTPTPYPPYTESNPPSGATFSGDAQQIIANTQLASQVDSNNQPTELQSNFNTGQEVYMVYQWIQGHHGYVYTLWYFNGQREDNLTNRSDLINNNMRGYGYMGSTFNSPGQGAVEVYYCTQSDCSDRQLAWVRPFSVVES